MQQFFRAAIRNPELSFNLILGLSIAAFLVGMALVVAGFTVALTINDTRTAIISGLFGGGGILAALGSIYTLASRSVSEANASHARIRLVLTDFATELGHLRAVDLKDIETINDVNKKIREAMAQAVDIIQTRVKI